MVAPFRVFTKCFGSKFFNLLYFNIYKPCFYFLTFNNYLNNFVSQKQIGMLRYRSTYGRAAAGSIIKMAFSCKLLPYFSHLQTFYIQSSKDIMAILDGVQLLDRKEIAVLQQTSMH